MKARRRSACGTPTARSAVRRRPDVEPVHGSGRVPELARVLGADRHGVVPERPGALDAVSDGDSSLTLALERPGASGDQGVYADRVELDGIRPRFPLPDFCGAYKYTEGWGYVGPPACSG